MPDKPIIMTGDEVRATMAGLKTQFRRVIRQARDGDDVAWGAFPARDSGYIAWFGLPMKDGAEFTKQEYTKGFQSPYQPGDTLWVRETWKAHEQPSGQDGILFRADDGFVSIENTEDAADKWMEARAIGTRYSTWQNPLFMPRWASRLSLLVTNVRAQRVQDISEEDAIAEGMVGPINPENMWQCGLMPSKAYAVRWDQLNAKRGHPFSANDWVFAYTFERKG